MELIPVLHGIVQHPCSEYYACRVRVRIERLEGESTVQLQAFVTIDNAAVRNPFLSLVLCDPKP